MGRGRFCLAYLLVPTILLLACILSRPAPAGDYHAGATLLCYDCHTMHFSQSYGFTGGTVSTTAAPGGDWLGTGGPFKNLLKAGSTTSPINDLCLACHDGQGFAPDVLEGHSNGYVRQAGALNRGGGAPYQTWKGHTLGATASPPGHGRLTVGCSTCHPSHGGLVAPLRCTHCHDHHGSANHRNLLSAVSVTYAKGTNDTAKDVFVRKYYGDGTSTLAERYSADNVDFNEPVANASALG